MTAEVNDARVLRPSVRSDYARMGWEVAMAIPRSERKQAQEALKTPPYSLLPFVRVAYPEDLEDASDGEVALWACGFTAGILGFWVVAGDYMDVWQVIGDDLCRATAKLTPERR